MKTHLRAAAWVPDDDPERAWEDAADLAAEWIWERSEAEDVPPMLVTNTFQNAIGIASLSEIARGGGQATPQGNERFQHGPVLAYVPNERTMELALDLARGYSLVIVETISFPLSEWAAAAGAINLLIGDPTATAIPSDVTADLDRAIFFGGNNGWTGSHEEQHARTTLSAHVRSHRLDPDAAVSYAMAHGVSDRGAKRLRALIETMAR
ncbi:hypothetical protein DF223_10400 [Mycetocola zhujimingii]|uniref:Uncharacterized protein n=1 Tax=Mycetocola zhujimingii TaxID=2079792 RepID=A0A2U1TCV6_9MICO|nr:hypothetical protein DF223_10400 [Mycetocola zhujimingii]